MDLQVGVEGTSRTVRWPDERLGKVHYFEPSESEDELLGAHRRKIESWRKRRRAKKKAARSSLRACVQLSNATEHFMHPVELQLHPDTIEL